MKTYLRNMVSHFYKYFFARKIFYKFNKLVYFISLNGLGISDYNNSTRGEKYFLKKIRRHLKNAVVFDVGANEGEYSVNIRSLSQNAVVYGLKIFSSHYGQKCLF